MAIGASERAVRHSTLPWVRCLQEPISAVGMITTSEVPMAILMSRIGGLRKNIIAGTITTPPPTPNRPLVTPPTKPITPAYRYFPAHKKPIARLRRFMVVVNAFHVTGRQLFSSPVSRLLSVVRDYSARAGLALATDNGTRLLTDPLRDMRIARASSGRKIPCRDW